MFWLSKNFNKQNFGQKKFGSQQNCWWSKKNWAVKKMSKKNWAVKKNVGGQKRDAVMHSLTNEIAILYKLNMCRINKSSKQK